MKNKIIMRITTALFAALILMGGFSIPAYAGGGGDATNDSNVKTEEKKEEKKPLTPDGNMSLIDNIKGDAAKDKEFIIVKSKGGNYFYIVIDHAAQGENTVHFLNVGVSVVNALSKWLIATVKRDGFTFKQSHVSSLLFMS